jgi:hypothetical protein
MTRTAPGNFQLCAFVPCFPRTALPRSSQRAKVGRMSRWSASDRSGCLSNLGGRQCDRSRTTWTVGRPALRSGGAERQGCARSSDRTPLDAAASAAAEGGGRQGTRRGRGPRLASGATGTEAPSKPQCPVGAACGGQGRPFVRQPLASLTAPPPTAVDLCGLLLGARGWHDLRGRTPSGLAASGAWLGRQMRPVLGDHLPRWQAEHGRDLARVLDSTGHVALVASVENAQHLDRTGIAGARPCHGGKATCFA